MKNDFEELGRPVVIPPRTTAEINETHERMELDKPVPSKRTFDTGATRDTETDKLDYEGFLSPLVLKRYAEYLNGHRTMSDGSTRDSDNWQKGIPFDVYMKSTYRHFVDMWMVHRLWRPDIGNFMEDAMCAILFNVMGYLHERLAKQLITVAKRDLDDDISF